MSLAYKLNVNTDNWHSVVLDERWCDSHFLHRPRLRAINAFTEQNKEMLDWLVENIPFHKIDVVEVHKRDSTSLLIFKLLVLKESSLLHWKLRWR